MRKSWASSRAELLARAALVLFFATTSPHAVEAGDRFREIRAEPRERADWIADGAGHLVFGAGSRIVLPDKVLESEMAIDGGAVVGDRAFLVGKDRAIRVLDLRSPGTPEVVALAPAARGSLHVAAMDRWLVIAEDGLGVRFVPVRDGHGCHASTPRSTGLVVLPEEFTALGTRGRTVYAALRGRRIVEIDARDPARPSIGRTFALREEAEALEAVGPKLYVLGKGGLEIVDFEHGPELHGEVRGKGIAVSGRRLLVAGTAKGLVTYRDTSAAAQLFEVSANSDFFSPQDLTVALGDTVRWTNVTGDLHNVFSCTVDQIGCDDGASTESFTSGPATEFWVAEHTFTKPGTNPYVCQPHATFMTGSVTVTGGAGTPPGVPAMQVGKLAPDGSTLSVSWDAGSCTGAVGHQILYGYAFGLPPSTGGGYELAGSACSIGAGSPFTWSAVPPAFSGPTGWVWWLVTATDGGATEGSWGKASQGLERDGPGTSGSSGECGIVTKSLANACGQ